MSNDKVGEGVSKSTLHLLSLVTTMLTALGEKKDLLEQQGLDFTFLLLLKLRLRNTRTECFWPSCTINILEPELISCVPVYYPLRWDRELATLSEVSEPCTQCTVLVSSGSVFLVNNWKYPSGEV